MRVSMSYLKQQFIFFFFVGKSNSGSVLCVCVVFRCTLAIPKPNCRYREGIDLVLAVSGGKTSHSRAFTLAEDELIAFSQRYQLITVRSVN